MKNNLKYSILIVLLLFVGCKNNQRYEIYINGRNEHMGWGEYYHQGRLTDSGYLFIRNYSLDSLNKRNNDTILISIHKVPAK